MRCLSDITLYKHYLSRKCALLNHRRSSRASSSSTLVSNRCPYNCPPFLEGVAEHRLVAVVAGSNLVEVDPVGSSPVEVDLAGNCLVEVPVGNFPAGDFLVGNFPEVVDLVDSNPCSFCRFEALSKDWLPKGLFIVGLACLITKKICAYIPSKFSGVNKTINKQKKKSDLCKTVKLLVYIQFSQ